MKGARFVLKVQLAQKLSRTHPMELLGDWVMWILVSICLETILVLTQYRCTVCAKHTMGSEIILDAPNDTPR
jgi:hypothetical protein